MHDVINCHLNGTCMTFLLFSDIPLKGGFFELLYIIQGTQSVSLLDVSKTVPKRKQIFQRKFLADVRNIISGGYVYSI